MFCLLAGSHRRARRRRRQKARSVVGKFACVCAVPLSAPDGPQSSHKRKGKKWARELGCVCVNWWPFSPIYFNWGLGHAYIRRCRRLASPHMCAAPRRCCYHHFWGAAHAVAAKLTLDGGQKIKYHQLLTLSSCFGMLTLVWNSQILSGAESCVSFLVYFFLDL